MIVFDNRRMAETKLTLICIKYNEIVNEARRFGLEFFFTGVSFTGPIDYSCIHLCFFFVFWIFVFSFFVRLKQIKHLPYIDIIPQFYFVNKPILFLAKFLSNSLGKNNIRKKYFFSICFPVYMMMMMMILVFWLKSHANIFLTLWLLSFVFSVFWTQSRTFNSRCRRKKIYISR